MAKLTPEMRQLIAAGQLLYGEFYTKRLAQAVGVHLETLRRWKRGEGHPRWPHWYALIFHLRVHLLQAEDAYNSALDRCAAKPGPVPKLPPVQHGAVADPEPFRSHVDPIVQHPTATAPRRSDGTFMPGSRGHYPKPRELPMLVRPRQRRTKRAVQEESA